jgi:hypothetical protein
MPLNLVCNDKRIGRREASLLGKKTVSKVGWVLDAVVLAELRKCPDCRSEPAVFLTAKKVPCCRLHWEKIADGVGVASVELEVPKVDECVDFEETAKYPVSGCHCIKVPRVEEEGEL